MPREFDEPYTGWNDIEQREMDMQAERDYRELEYEHPLPPPLPQPPKKESMK